jgi:hypothetical protein
MGDNKRRKLVVIGQDCVEPLQALRSSGQEVVCFSYDSTLMFFPTFRDYFIRHFCRPLNSKYGTLGLQYERFLLFENTVNSKSCYIYHLKKKFS